MSDLLPLPLRVAHASAKLQIKIKRIAAIFRPEIETYPAVPACLIIVSGPPYHRYVLAVAPKELQPITLRLSMQKTLSDA
jgi:hypothetical protein